MAVHHYTATCLTTAQTLGAAITGEVKDVIKFLSLQAAPGNTGLIYVGGKSETLSTTNYGWLIPVPVTSIPAAPAIIELPQGFFNIDDIQVLSANASEKLAVLIVTS